jgi:hypothetical protein
MERGTLLVRDNPRRRVAQISPVRPVTEDGPVDVLLTRANSESDGCGRPGPFWDGEAESADRAAELGERRLVLLSAGVPEPWCNRILSNLGIMGMAAEDGPCLSCLAGDVMDARGDRDRLVKIVPNGSCSGNKDVTDQTRWGYLRPAAESPLSRVRVPHAATSATTTETLSRPP